MDVQTLLLDTTRIPGYISSGYRTFGVGKRHVNRTLNITVLVMVLEGELYYEMDGVPGCVSAGEWMLEPPMAVMRGTRPCARQLRFFFTHFEPLARSESSFGTHIDMPGDIDTPMQAHISLPLNGSFRPEQFIPLFNHMEDTAQSAPNNFLYKQSLFLQLLSALAEIAKPHLPSRERLASEVYDYLTITFAKPLQGKDLEARFHFSSDYLSRLLKIYYGASAKELLVRFRINCAKDLLSHTSLTVEEIAMQSGFGDVTQFHKHFKSRTGITPAGFRKTLL